MKAIIMAAGMGTRMQKMHGDIPKGTIPIGNSSILLNMVKALNENGITDPKDIIIVGGYKCEMIKKHIGDKATVIYNPFYDVSDDIVSLWVAQRYMNPEEGFIYFHGDTVFGKEFISKLVNDPRERVMLVEKKECDEEDSKVIVDGKNVLRVSKKVPISEAFGEFSGIAKFSGEGVKSFVKHLNKVVEERGRKNYESETIQSMIDAGEKVSFVLTDGIPFCEIDFPKDLEYALKNKEKFGL